MARHLGNTGNMGELFLDFTEPLRMFLRPRRRTGTVRARWDGSAPVGHVIESLGVPLPEVGEVFVHDAPVTPAYRPAGGDRIAVAAVARPQPLTAARFLLDVHLGTLARYLRVTGVDTAYPGDRPDEELIDRANAARRTLLTRDRALLCQRRLVSGAYVRGARPPAQLCDVLDRFAPTLQPWTRCTDCNGELRGVDKREVEHLLHPGTRRCYEHFARCAACGQVYWRGAHSRRLESIVDLAFRCRREPN